MTLTPDTGRAWMILIATSIVLFLNEGYRKALSVLLPTLRDQFETQTWMIGVMISLLHAVRDFSAPMSGILVSKLDHRLLGISAGIVSSVSVLSSAFATNVPMLVLLSSVTNGIAISVIQITCYSLLGRVFDKFYPLVTGISYLFGTIGIIVYAPMAQLFLDNYGWRNTILLFGVLQFHMVISGILLRNIKSVYDELETEIVHVEDTYTSVVSCASTEEASGKRTRWKSSSNYINVDRVKQLVMDFLEASGLFLFTNSSYISISVAYGSLNATITGWVVYFVPRCLSKGLTPYQSAFLASLTSVWYIIGSIIYIPFVERNMISVRNYLYLMHIVATISLLVDSNCFSFGAILLSNGCFLFCIAGVFPLLDVKLKEVVGKDSLSKALGWRMTVGGVSRLICCFIIGFSYDKSGSFDVGFYFLAAVQGLGGLALAADHKRP